MNFNNKPFSLILFLSAKLYAFDDSCFMIYQPNESYRGCLLWLRQTYPIETDMSERRGFPLRLIWLRRLNQSLNRYDWGVKLTVDTNMTVTPGPKLAQIWLRRPEKSLFPSVSQSQVCRIEKRGQNILGCLSHIIWVILYDSYLC